MNRQQKIAWYNLIVLTIGLVLVVVLANTRMPKLALVVLVGTGVFVGISGLLFRKKQGKVDFDERDARIRLTACFIALGASVGMAVALSIMQAFKVGSKGSVSVSTVIGILGGAYIAFIVTKSIFTLCQYGWRSRNGES